MICSPAQNEQAQRFRKERKIKDKPDDASHRTAPRRAPVPWDHFNDAIFVDSRESWLACRSYLLFPLLTKNSWKRYYRMSHWDRMSRRWFYSVHLTVTLIAFKLQQIIDWLYIYRSVTAGDNFVLSQENVKMENGRESLRGRVVNQKNNIWLAFSRDCSFRQH